MRIIKDVKRNASGIIAILLCIFGVFYVPDANGLFIIIMAIVAASIGNEISGFYHDQLLNAKLDLMINLFTAFHRGDNEEIDKLQKVAHNCDIERVRLGIDYSTLGIKPPNNKEE